MKIEKYNNFFDDIQGLNSFRSICGAGMMGDVIWDKMSDEHVKMLQRKTDRLYEKVKDLKPQRHMKLKERAEFSACKEIHKMVLKGEKTPGLDNQYYIEHGWIEDNK